MKYIKRISVILTLVLSVIFLAKTGEVKATTVESLKELWYETKYYPMTPESDEWMIYGLEEAIDILNPPEDLLHSFSTEELAKLMMNYPYLWVLTSYEYEDMDYFFDYVKYNCDIYNELMRRDDGVLCLLKEYQQSDFNANLYNEDPYIVWGYNPLANAEVFGCQFIVYNSNDFDNDESELCAQVISEKTDLYTELNDNIAKQYLSFEREQPSLNYYADAIIANEPTNLVMSSSNGFTATGSPYIKSIENVDIYFTPGNYKKYGVSDSCLQWYSGDYDEATRESNDNRIAYPWYRLSRSSPKYNCHAYAWLNAHASDGYWLESPEKYMKSSSVKHAGSNITPTVGDIVVMYNMSTGAIVHSAVISQTPSGSTGTYTISKISGLGLYRAPLSELMNYYSCDKYDVYRIN